MRAFGYHILFLGFLAQLGCANSHSSTAQDSPPMMGASTTPAAETEQPSVKVPPGYANASAAPAPETERPSVNDPAGDATIPVSHAEAVHLNPAMQDRMAMPKFQPGKGIDYDREMQSCLDMLPDNVRMQVEQAGTK